MAAEPFKFVKNGRLPGVRSLFVLSMVAITVTCSRVQMTLPPWPRRLVARHIEQMEVVFHDHDMFLWEALADIRNVAAERWKARRDLADVGYDQPLGFEQSPQPLPGACPASSFVLSRETPEKFSSICRLKRA